MCHFDGTFLLEVMILEIVGVAYSGVLFSLILGFCCPFIFLFRGIKYFNPKSQLRFRLVIDDSLASIIAVFSIGILIIAGVFVAGIQDLVTLVVYVMHQAIGWQSSEDE